MEKDLFFLRHAIAIPREAWSRPDEERPLTEAGRKKMVAAVRGMRHLGLEVEAVWSSPLIRAWQTAEIVKAHLPFSGKITSEKNLEPGGSLPALLEKIKSRKEKRMLLVGHEPEMSEWIQDLLGCGSSRTILLKKGALCQLRVVFSRHPPEAQMIFLLQPKALRRLN